MKSGVDYIGVTVCFYCYDKKGNLLLQKRSKNTRDENGRWDCGGGSMEFGENFEETVRRELKEEYCCDPLSLSFCGVSNVLRENEGVKTHWICIIFAAELDPKTVKIGEPKKIDELGWFKLSNLPEPLHTKLLYHLDFVKKAGLLGF